MKNTSLAIALWCCACFAAAQSPENTPCTFPQSQVDLGGNNIRARFLSAGDLFWDLQDGQFVHNPSAPGAKPSTISAASLWIGGIDPAGNLKIAANTYRSNGGTDFWPGPLQEDGITDAQACSNWDRHFIVKDSRIGEFWAKLPALAADPSAAIIQFRDIMGWPALGNPYFSSAWGFDLPASTSGLAPFFDKDGDGAYNPLKGDYPVVLLRGLTPIVPEELVWYVFNDQGGGATHSATQGEPLQVEVQVTAWTFNCPDKPVLNNTVFTSHKIIHRATERLDSCFVGMWVDFGIGCSGDDYVGCSPTRNSMYAYNIDAVDGLNGSACGGEPTFGGAPPVQSATFLGGTMDKFMYFGPATPALPPTVGGDPTKAAEFYNYLAGKWRDGAQPHQFGNGYEGAGAPVSHLFPDAPSEPNGWSMCTAGFGAGDRKALGSHKIGSLLPGQVEELNVAWTYHPRLNNGPCNLGPTMAQIDSVVFLYLNDFQDVCAPTSPTHDPVLDAAVRIFPNPTADAATVMYGDLSVLEIRCFDAAGRQVLHLSNPTSGQTVLDVSGLVPGIYTIQLTTQQGSVVRKLGVQ